MRARGRVALLGLATAVPPHEIRQPAAADLARRVYASSFARFPALADIFVNAGIDRRYSVRPLDWFLRDHDWHERTEAYLDGAQALFVAAARSALAEARIDARDVDAVVTVSSTGIATPSLEARVMGELGFRADVERVPVFGLGCAGGVTGLSIGAKLARAAPGDVVLVVAVELCTLAFRADRDDKADVISTALFGDGAAAAVLRVDADSAICLGLSAEHTWPDTLDIMGWSVDPAGFGVLLSRSLPKFVEQKIAAPARAFIETAKLASPRFILHPGGARVLDAMEAALGAGRNDFADERGVLRDYGNMSSPTVLFVLMRALARGLTGTAVMAALGPGFTASFLVVEAGRG